MSQHAPPKQLKKLKSLYNQGKFPEVISFSETLIKKHRTPYLIWHIYGIALVRTGKLEQAEKALLTAAKLNKSIPDIPYLLANVRKMRGNIEGALESFERTVQLAPKSADAHIQIGTIQGQKGQFQEAIASYNRALEIAPEQAEVLNNRGVFQREAGDFEGAAESYLRAIQMKPDYADAHFNLGRLRTDEGKLADAASSYARALRIDPTLAKARNALGAVLYEQGRFSDALTCYLEVLKTEPRYVKTIKNLARLPTEALSPEIIDGLEKKITSLSETEISPADKAFALADIQRLHDNRSEAFEIYCQANQIKHAQEKERNLIEAQKRQGVLSDIQTWHPKAKPTDGPVKTLFILGPSRAGKSTLERLLGRDPSVYCAQEACKISGKCTPAWLEQMEALKCGSLSQLKLDDLFFLGDKELASSSTKVITCTHPGIIHYIPELHETLPGAHFCMVGRNTVDLAAEIFVTNYTADNPHAYEADSILDYVEWYNSMWRAASDKIDGVTISYEEVLGHPVKTIQKIRQFLDCDLLSSDDAPLKPGPKSPFREFFEEAFVKDRPLSRRL